MDAASQVRDEALQSESAFRWSALRSSEGRLDLVDFHLCRRFLIGRVWLVHMGHDKVDGSLDVAITFAKGSRTCLLVEAHADDHH